ncbi:MAG TPA: hypothetical protein VND91_11940 [Candidatus Saccharimonadia bacterium]|nr:hypothetical protein [Candidatus Saccharimonadia bacterium]
MRESSSLAAALAALPLEDPAPGGFARIEATLAKRRTRTRVVHGLALAASLAAIAVIPFALLSDRAPSDVENAPIAATSAPSAPTTQGALIEQNELLEAWVRAQDEPFDGATAYASAELEDLIGMLDVELAATRDVESQDALWRQRLGLLSELASVRSQGVTRLATNDAALVPAAYRID